MKKGIMTLAMIGVIIAASAAVFARGGGYGVAGSGNGFGGNSYMQQELKLTDAQQDQIFKINQDYRQKFYDNRKDSSKFATLRDEHQKAVESVLTVEQKEKFATLQKDRGSRHKGHRW